MEREKAIDMLITDRGGELHEYMSDHPDRVSSAESNKYERFYRRESTSDSILDLAQRGSRYIAAVYGTPSALTNDARL